MKDKKVSIRIVFPFVMSVSIAVCIISCMFLFSHYFSGYFQRDTIEKVSKQKKTLAQDLEAEIENINELINSIYYQDIRTYDTATEMFQREMEQRMVRESEVLYSAAIYDADGSSLWHSEKLPDRNKAEVKQEDWFQNAQKNIETIHYGEKKLVQPDKARYVYEISRYIEYVENGNMKSGVLLLEYYTDSIDEVLLHYKSQKSAYCYLLDTNRRLLYHPFEKEIVSGMYQEKTVKEAMACKNYKIEEQSGGKWLIERQQIGYTGWNVVLVNSMSSLDFESYNLHYVAWFTLLLVGVILIFLDILLFRSFTDPVYRLLQTMQEFGKGNYDIKAKEEGIGELKNLSAHFNIMADKLQEQMEEIRRNECERQQMEKKLLQSQINPHFLYNTLDSIIWMIRSEEYEGAGKMVSLLAKFFRISLSQGKDMIPLEKELEHASSYLAIQNIRFKDKFEFQIEADPALLKYLCPKLSIQPLLENAIYHGMEGMYEDGEITIRIYDRDGDIGIDVADNGPGMTQETIDHIMHNKVISSKRGSGVGVRNVNERIQLIYGEDYGVTITSELDEGTTATITIPKMEETDDAR